MSDQGILKVEVSLYNWPPVWLVLNQLYDDWQFLFLFAKQDYSKPVEQEVNGTVIRPPSVFHGLIFRGLTEANVFFIDDSAENLCDQNDRGPMSLIYEFS